MKSILCAIFICAFTYVAANDNDMVSCPPPSTLQIINQVELKTFYKDKEWYGVLPPGAIYNASTAVNMGLNLSTRIDDNGYTDYDFRCDYTASSTITPNSPANVSIHYHYVQLRYPTQDSCGGSDCSISPN